MKREPLRDSFLTVARRYFILNAIVGFSGFAIGACLVGGAAVLFELAVVALVFGLGAGLLGMWMPVGLYYEDHHSRTLYVGLFESCVFAMTLALGYAVAQASS